MSLKKILLLNTQYKVLKYQLGIREQGTLLQEICIWVFDYCSTLLQKSPFWSPVLPLKKDLLPCTCRTLTEPLYYKNGLDVGFYSFAMSSSLSSESLIYLVCMEDHEVKSQPV